eukprot:TRINITY_DN94047_c1_g1_i1.p1 TRINITY_DN94047_c1_g1~~TRINITY_DN94047_c1_g1_i1.p1  ORF type:complete len:101 (-),score=10.50 TRINITY_DN94047_c1_g1_i1:226-501(-)
MALFLRNITRNYSAYKPFIATTNVYNNKPLLKNNYSVELTKEGATTQPLESYEPIPSYAYATAVASIVLLGFGFINLKKIINHAHHRESRV